MPINIKKYASTWSRLPDARKKWIEKYQWCIWGEECSSTKNARKALRHVTKKWSAACPEQRRICFTVCCRIISWYSRQKASRKSTSSCSRCQTFILSRFQKWRNKIRRTEIGLVHKEVMSLEQFSDAFEKMQSYRQLMYTVDSNFLRQLTFIDSLNFIFSSFAHFLKSEFLFT